MERKQTDQSQSPPLNSAGHLAGPNNHADRVTKRASQASFIFSVLILAFKFWGYQVTHSQAVFSDAMESIANVVAAAMATIVVAIAAKPADKDHPYGHGKIEFFSATFEGGLITIASIIICYEAIKNLFGGLQVVAPGTGIAVSVAAGLGNAGLGFYLCRIGRKYYSAALEASGLHVLSDFWTSVGVSLGLILVYFTGLTWLDSVTALVVGLYLGWTGVQLVRGSIGGLLDAEDSAILDHLVEIMGDDRPDGIIQVHHCRVIRSGRFHHIDAHAVVPEFWDVAEAHDRTDSFEAKLMEHYHYSGELHLHMDPCRQAYCRECSLQNCPIRRQPFFAKRRLTIEELTAPDEPLEFK